MKALSLCAGVLLVLGCTVTGARAQAPVPLPTDPSLAAYVSAAGTFRSESLGEECALTLRSWAAEYGAGEAIDFASMTERAFLTLDLPEEGGWGLFTPVDDHLTVSVHITDALGRLGRVRLTDHATGALLAELPANGAHTAIQSSFSCDVAVREIVATLLSTSDATLATLAVDLGKFDTVAWYKVDSGFVPYCPAPIACSRYVPMGPPGGSDFHGTIGDPTSAAGTLTGATPLGTSTGCACADVTNDEANIRNQPAPLPYMDYVKRDVILNTVNPQSIKMGDPAAMTALNNLLTALTTRDPARALGNTTFPPYSTGYGYWQIDFTGLATAILGVPFERVRKGGSWNIVIGAILPLLQPAHTLLSSLVTSAANDWLADQQNQQASKFKQGDVFALGDVYALTASQHTAEPRGLAPILAPVTFQLAPDIAPDSGVGIAAVTQGAANTTPAPPPAPGGYQLNFTSGSAPPWTTVVQLPKGWHWSVSGSVATPPGYTAGPAYQFTSPETSTVLVRCTLTKLLVLEVTVTLPPGCVAPVQVTLKQGTTVLGVQAATRIDATTYVASFTQLSPGSYTVEGVATHWPPPPATGSLPFTVPTPAKLQEVTLPLSR